MRLASAVPSRPRAPEAVWWQLARRSFSRMATYRGATIAGVFTNSVFGFLRAYVLLAVLEARPGLGGYDARDALTYTFLTQALLATVYAFGDNDIADRIRTGDIVSDLYRPLDFQGYWLATDIGRAGFHMIFRGIPPFLVGLAAFDLRFPPDTLLWPAFLASAWLGVITSFAIRFAVSCSGFWLLDSRGVWQIAAVVSMFFAGIFLPLPFFPDWLLVVARWLPFAGLAQVPIDVFLGEHRGLLDLGFVLGRQAAWALVLLAIGRPVSARAFHKVVVQGG
jgi:ABC-2 type transport system permease protein